MKLWGGKSQPNLVDEFVAKISITLVALQGLLSACPVLASEPYAVVASCYQAVRDTKEFSAIQKKVPVTSLEQQADAFTISAKPSLKERQLLLRYLSRIAECDQSEFDVTKTIGLSLDSLPFYVTWDKKRKELYEQLKIGMISFSDFASSRKSASDIYYAQLRDFIQRSAMQKKAQEDAQLAARREADEDTRRMIQQQEEREAQAARDRIAMEQQRQAYYDKLKKEKEYAYRDCFSSCLMRAGATSSSFGGGLSDCDQKCTR